MLKNNTHKKSNSKKNNKLLNKKYKSKKNLKKGLNYYKKNNLKYSKKKGGAAAEEPPPALLIERILAIHDPSVKGIPDGDVDDWMSIIYLCDYLDNKKQRENLTRENTKYQLHIIIKDGASRGSNPQYFTMVKLLEAMYPKIVVFYLDHDLIKIQKVASEKTFNLCFISSPVTDLISFSLNTLFNEETKKPFPIFYLQGENINEPLGYNYKQSSTNGKETINRLRPIVINSDSSNQAFHKKLLVKELTKGETVTDEDLEKQLEQKELKNAEPLNPAALEELVSQERVSTTTPVTYESVYNTTPFFNCWDTYQLKKLFSVIKIPNLLPFVIGFWFTKAEDPWGGMGNSKDTLDIIKASINVDLKVSKEKIIAEYKEDYNFLKKLYDEYCDEVCNAKLVSLKELVRTQTSDREKLESQKLEESELIKKQKELDDKIRETSTLITEGERDLDEKKTNLKQVYDEIIVLAFFIFQSETYEKLVLDDKKTINNWRRIKDLGQLDNFGMVRELQYTPKLYDYNMSSLIIYMNDNSLDIKNQDSILEQVKLFHGLGGVNTNIENESPSSNIFRNFLISFNEKYESLKEKPPFFPIYYDDLYDEIEMYFN